MLTLIYYILGAYLFLPLLNLLLGVHPFTFKTDSNPARFGLPYESVAFDTDDGITIRGWWIPAATTDARHTQLDKAKQRTKPPTIVVGHGYPFDKANILPHVFFLHRRFHLLLIDFRYFGESDGLYTTVGIREVRDVQAAVNYLQEQEIVDPTRIGAMGFSMSASTFILAQNPAIKAIVADSPYASLNQIVERQFFFLPGPLKWPVVMLTQFYTKLLLGLDIEKAAPVNAVRDLKAPLLLIHGEEDSQIPINHSEEIAANSNPDTTQLWRIPRADHGQAHALAGRQYEERVLNFFSQHL